MPWSNQGGGPWGSGGKGPWGSGPQSSGPTPPDLEEFLRELASQAGICDAEDFAQQWQILMRGSIVAACEGDRGAALRAKKIGRLLLSAATSRRTREIASNGYSDR